jgi:hypothetical protein
MKMEIFLKVVMKSYTWVQSNLDFLKAGSAMKNLGYT